MKLTRSLYQAICVDKTQKTIGEYEKMNQEDINNILGNATIGKEPEPLKPQRVKIEAVDIEPVSKSNGDFVGNKLVFSVKYPDMETPIKISQAKIQKGDKVKVVGTWFNPEDDAYEIPFNSAVAHILRLLDVGTIPECIGKEIDTTSEGSYLVFKVY
jgi:hypothetical protein